MTAAQELRIHGVGGSHGARMLGYESPHDVVVVGEGMGGTAVFARRSDPTVESYDWGDLTSGTGSKPFWVLLLPFTLLNVAGWMHPPWDRASPARVRSVRAVVHLLSVLLTAIYVFGAGVLLVDLAGYQWTGRLAAPADEAAYPLTGPAVLQTQQRWGVVVGLAALLAGVAALVHIAGSSQVRFERRGAPGPGGPGPTGEEPWGDDERLDSPGFFFHPGAARARLGLHLAVAGLSYLLVAGWTVYRVFLDAGSPPPDRLDVSRFLGACSAAAFLGVLVLWILSLGVRRRPGERWTRSGPAIAATLGLGLVNAFLSGVMLLAVKQLNDWPAKPEGAPVLQAGPEVNLVDVWGGLVVGLGLAAAVLVVVVVFFPRAGADDITRTRSSRPGWRIDGLDGSMRKSVVRSRFLATLAGRAGLIAFLVAAVIYAAGFASVVVRLDPGERLWLPPPTNTAAPLYQVGAYVLPLLALLLVQLVRKGRQGARTFASTLWDVLTFWPRRFAPFAVRPYAERAVPELQGRILQLVRDQEHPCPLVVTGHSQGSILAFAALSSLPPDVLARMALVTYGSPISTIYGTFFPAYFGRAEVESLRAKLRPPGPGLVGWRNFYRRTDPIGGPVFAGGADGDGAAAGDPEADRELADPFPGPGPVGTGTDAVPPLECDPTPWIRVAGHSYYLQEPELKWWVAAVREALGRG